MDNNKRMISVAVPFKRGFVGACAHYENGVHTELIAQDHIYVNHQAIYRDDFSTAE